MMTLYFESDIFKSHLLVKEVDKIFWDIFVPFTHSGPLSRKDCSQPISMKYSKKVLDIYP